MNSCSPSPFHDLSYMTDTKPDMRFAFTRSHQRHQRNTAVSINVYVHMSCVKGEAVFIERIEPIQSVLAENQYFTKFQ
ncbi:hypothetical protein JOB18_044294 [Solea senegalensis]|uniref:Uncharacterized protein n=1 Tax=Solea senegalensis TaxID=28829 RepID=A0AAV6QZX1_SOLSE|nr:hypothetical protein JOB18_044294 [Solea senegalensis]